LSAGAFDLTVSGLSKKSGQGQTDSYRRGCRLDSLPHGLIVDGQPFLSPYGDSLMTESSDTSLALPGTKLLEILIELKNVMIVSHSSPEASSELSRIQWKRRFDDEISSADHLALLELIEKKGRIGDATVFQNRLNEFVGAFDFLSGNKIKLTRRLTNLAECSVYRAPYAILRLLIAQLSTAVGGATAGTHKTEASDGVEDWREVREKADNIRIAGQPFGSYRSLAEKIGCKPTTLHKAISKHGTVELQEWASKPKRESRKYVTPEAASIGIRNASQRREPDPSEALFDGDAEAVLAYLLEQSTPTEAAEINKMTAAEKRQLAETYYRDFDKEEQLERYAKRKRPTEVTG
jgi:hypothetical protein